MAITVIYRIDKQRYAEIKVLINDKGCLIRYLHSKIWDSNVFLEKNKASNDVRKAMFGSANVYTIGYDLSCLSGWSGGAMVLGKPPVPRRTTIWMIVGQGLLRLQYVWVGGFGPFLLSSIFSLLFLPLCETGRYRLKYCLTGR